MIYFKLDTTLTVILLLTASTPWSSCEPVTETTTPFIPLEYTIIHNDSEIQSDTFEVTTDLSQTQAPTTIEYEDALDLEYQNTIEEVQYIQHQNSTNVEEEEEEEEEGEEEEETQDKEGYQEYYDTESVLTFTETTDGLDEYQSTYDVTEDEFGSVTDTTMSEDGTTPLPDTDSTTSSDEDLTTTYQPLMLDNNVFKDVRIEDNLVDIDLIHEDLDHLLDLEAEMEDEKDDLKIFEAVVNSMAEYNLRKLEKKRHNRRVKRDEELVCYKDLGCFKDEGPFDLMDMLPSKPEEVNTIFLLYTRENKDREQLITYQNISSILNSNFDRNRPTKVIVHGFGSSCFRVWVREMRDTFLHRMDVNVICVNWENGASVPNYVRAASNSRLVGAQLAVLLESLQRYMNTSLDDVHLVGFSLGAHVAGFAGHRLKNVARITGLDPAGPLFEEYPEKMRLDAGDARFVDVIHTNADSLIMGGLGAFQPMGHVDFYPNGGRMQKGCANLFVGGVSDILWPMEGENGRYLCNHRRGYQYFTASVTPQCIFPSFVCRDYENFLKGDCFPCNNCGKMGYYAEEALGRGQLYLVTSEMEPFCANQYKVSVFHSGGPPAEEFTSYGRIDVTFVAQNGLNETLPLTRSEDQEMVAGGTTMRIMVPHPAISAIQALQLRYTAYQGWIYSGYKSWAIDKISVMDSFGKTVTFCNLGTTLVSSKTMHFTLLPGDCSPLDAQPGSYVKPWQVQDPVSEIETNNASTEGDASGMVPLQTIPSSHSDPNHKTSQDNGSAPNIASAIPSNPNHILPSDKPIPKPVLTVMEPHGGILVAPGESQYPLLAITLEVPPKVYTNVQTFSSHSSSHFDIIGVTEHPTLLEDVNEHIVDDVAVSSEEPVNIIPAPNLALKHNINISLDSNARRPSIGMTPPNDKKYEEIHREDGTTPKVFTVFNATYSPNTNSNHILSSYLSTTNSISDTTIINGSSHFSIHSALPGYVTAIATDRVDDEEGIYISTPGHKDSNDEKLETLLTHQPQEYINSNIERLEAILPQHQPQEFIIHNETLKAILPQHQPQEFIIHNEALKAILPQHQPQEFLNSHSEASESNLPQHQPQQYIIPEQSDEPNLAVNPSNNTLQVNIESGLPGEYYGYYTGDTFSDMSPGDYFLKPLKSSLDDSLGDVDPNSSFAFSNSLVIGEVPARERARALNGASLNINVFASQTDDKEKTRQKNPVNLNQQKSQYNINYQAFKNLSLNGSNSTANTVNSSQLITNLANFRISSLANPNSTTPFLHHIISNPSNLNPILINSRPALHLVPPIPDSLPYNGPAAPIQANIQSYSTYKHNKNPAEASITSEQPILRPDAMRPSYSRPSHQNSQLRPPPPHSPPPPHTPILETIIGRGRAPRPYVFRKQSLTHENQQSKLVEQIENLNPGNWTVKENHSYPQQIYVQILPASFRNIPHLETSFLPPRDGRKLHGRSGRGHSFVPPILVPQGAHTHPVYLQLQNNRQNRYIPLRHSPTVGT